MNGRNEADDPAWSGIRDEWQRQHTAEQEITSSLRWLRKSGNCLCDSYIERENRRREMFPSIHADDDFLPFQTEADTHLADAMKKASTYNAGFDKRIEAIALRIFRERSMDKEEFDPAELVGLVYAVASSLWYDRQEAGHGARPIGRLEEENQHLRGQVGNLYRKLERKRGKGGTRSVTRAMREEVLSRDGYACLNCGATEDLHIDHVVAFSDGGKCAVENLQTLCRTCNIRKGTRFLDLRVAA